MLLDQSILELDVIICGTGRNDASLEITARDLVRVAGADVGSYAKDGLTHRLRRQDAPQGHEALTGRDTAEQSTS